MFKLTAASSSRQPVGHFNRGPWQTTLLVLVAVGLTGQPTTPAAPPITPKEAEAKTAAANGYLAFKTKGRPWFDIWEQAKQGNAASPEGFSITFDYNDTLLDAERGIPILKAVEQHPITKMVETPIPQRNVPDGIEIKRHTRAKVAHHFGIDDERLHELGAY